MSLPIAKTESYIQPPSNDPLDVSSGMQPATVNGGIGVPTPTAGADVAGASIGGAVATDYHIVI